MEPVRVEALLQDRAWLKGLARSLVRDEATADDLAQDGWLAALKRPPTRHVRAWWRRVLVRRAIDLRREQERRRAREGRAPAPETPSPELLERVELQETVARAVRELPEPYRGVILLRYFEGLPPRAIAQRLAVPVETVRTRLKRAHALLREQLGRERRDWKSAMLLVAWPGSLTKFLGGMTVMAQGKKISIVALLILALSLFLTWGGLGGTEPQPRAAEPARAAVPVADEPASVRPVPVHTGWTIVVRTLRRDKNALGGVTVQAKVVADGISVNEQALTTDGLGTAAWLLPAYEETVRLDLRAASPGLPDAWREVLVAAGSRPPNAIEVRLGGLDGLVTGRVVDAQGKPIKEATVETSSGRATTGADGKYALAVPTEHGDVYVWASAPKYAFERVAVVLRDGRGTADLRLREEFRIRGIVTDEEGRPVHGAVVRTFFTGYFQHAVSGRDGSYLLAHLDPGRNEQNLEAGHPRYVSFAKQIPTVGAETTVEIVLRKGLDLAGRVEGPDGQPVVGAKVTVAESHDPVSFGDFATETGEDGSFAFGPRLDPGGRPVIVDHPGYAPLSRKIALPTDGPVTLQLEPAHHISGTAVDDLGRPIEIWLSARIGDEYLPRATMSDAEGRWRLEGVPSGAIDLEFYGEQFQRTTVRGVEADRRDVAVTVPRAAVFKGRVVDDATGKPVRSFTLVVTCTSVPGIHATWVREGYRIEDNDGRWTIAEAFAPGVVAGIEVRVDGYMPGRGTATAALEPDPEECVVRMRRGIVAEGIILDDDTDRPIEGADVRVEPAGSSLWLQGETHRRDVQRTAADGRFRFTAVAPGFNLSVDHPGHAPLVQPVVEDGPLTIRLHGGCVIEGTATAGDEISLFGDDKSRDAVADERGRFRFERLPEGEYRLARRIRRVEPPRTLFAYPIMRKVEVARGRPVDVELKALGAATVRGRIDGRKGVDGSVVYLVPDDERLRVSVFVSEGTFEFTGVEAGRYRVIAPGADPSGPGPEIDVRDGETQEVTLKAAD